MKIKRIIPNIASRKMEESKDFYKNFLGLNLVMDMEWILTFASASNPTAQISIVKSNELMIPNDQVTLSFEVSDIDTLYKKAKDLNYEITYSITNEPWGVRRFFVKDPNGIIINMMCHIG